MRKTVVESTVNEPRPGRTSAGSGMTPLRAAIGSAAHTASTAAFTAVLYALSTLESCGTSLLYLIANAIRFIVILRRKLRPSGRRGIGWRMLVAALLESPHIDANTN
jgi:hypothetical protein